MFKCRARQDAASDRGSYRKPASVDAVRRLEVRGFAACLAMLVSAGACAQERVPVIGLPCDGCEAVFEGIPAEIPSRVRIGAAD